MEIPVFSYVPGFEDLPFKQQIMEYKSFLAANYHPKMKELCDLVDAVCGTVFNSDMEAMVCFLDGAERLMSNATPGQRRLLDRVQKAELSEMEQICREYVSREGAEVARPSSEHSGDAQ